MGQNTSHCDVLYTIEKVLKCRCPKWPHNLDICNPSYGQKKGRKSNWQFDSRPLKVENRPDLDVRWRVLYVIGKVSTRATRLLETLSRSEVEARSYDHPKSRECKLGQFWEFRDSTSGVPRKCDIQMRVPRRVTKYTIWEKVVASLESGPWWVKWIRSCPWLVPTPKGCRMNFNQLVVGFDADSSKWITCPHPSLIRGLLAHPSHRL
jgi:hypothetical protein